MRDPLGNIRITIDANGVVKAYDDYYPFGLQIPGRTYNQGLENPIYKYSSKVVVPTKSGRRSAHRQKLDDENILNWYYFGARYYRSPPQGGRRPAISR